ncbi:MAG: 2,3-bisphosphoglycerate-independent phosphoglycerate mutase, partial [Alphaproteobacteria bacterium]
MSRAKRPRPVVLCILDGWGHRVECEDNAICGGKTPVWDRLSATCPMALVSTSGSEVGLPAGQMGNSEVGHMNIGAGRIVMQDLPRIDQAVAEDTLRAQPALVDFVAALRASGGTAHLLGLVSPGGVHSHQDHIAALARIVADGGVPVALHAFLDGRDTPPRAADGYVAKLAGDVADLEGVRIATVSGRYYSMDRDKRWPRIKRAYNALVLAEGVPGDDPIAAIHASYADGTGDEFMEPTVIGGYAGMRDADGVLMANFRADRARQILTALLDPAFDGFARKRVVHFAAALGLTAYSAELNKLMGAIFPPLELEGVLGELVAEAGLKQLRIAETEKYAHVTFFFNGGREQQFPGEDRILVPSPKVATYDLKPEMSAYEVTDRLVAAIEAGTHDVVILNYANGDMVGHTGDYAAATKAVEAIDECLGRLEKTVRKKGGTLLITSDHGNCERMVDPETGQPHTAHTLEPVPLIMVGAPPGVEQLVDGRLSDIAPTILELLGMEQPSRMTGRSLIVRAGG